MRKINWSSALRWMLAAFFVFGGIGNIFASQIILTDYQRWGYPGWFHYLVGFLELSAATLLIARPRHLYGAILGGAVMLAAAATVIVHGEYLHAIPPFVVFVLCTLVWVLMARTDAGSQT